MKIRAIFVLVASSTAFSSLATTSEPPHYEFRTPTVLLRFVSMERTSQRQEVMRYTIKNLQNTKVAVALFRSSLNLGMCDDPAHSTVPLVEGAAGYSGRWVGLILEAGEEAPQVVVASANCLRSDPTLDLIGDLAVRRYDGLIRTERFWLGPFKWPE